MASTAKQGPGKAQKKGRSGGRVTPSAKSGSGKGRRHPRAPSRAAATRHPSTGGTKVSPRWFGVLIVAMFALGVLIVILNYADLLPGGVNNAWLVAAIGAIFVGLLLATRYH